MVESFSKQLSLLSSAGKSKMSYRRPLCRSHKKSLFLYVKPIMANSVSRPLQEIHAKQSIIEENLKIVHE
jgi:hypothetical protein